MGFSSSLPQELWGVHLRSQEAFSTLTRENKGPQDTLWVSQGPPNATCLLTSCSVSSRRKRKVPSD